MSSCFDSAGCVPLADLDDPRCVAVRMRLAAEQHRFLELAPRFRSPGYRWPPDALHNWSRVFEYPFVFHHLERWRSSLAPRPAVVDFGSGVTFFPWSVAALDVDVICLDIDPVCAVDIPKADAVLREAGVASAGRVVFRQVAGPRLPLDDASADALYSVSVLEHVPTRLATVAEFARALRPGGLLVATVDLDLRGDQEIAPDDLRRLHQEIERHFEPVLPPRDPPRADLLTSVNSPWGFSRMSTTLRARRWLKQRLLKPLLGRPRGHVIPYDLAVHVGVWRRREIAAPQGE